MTGDLPILEFDPAPDALIDPQRIIAPIEIPERCVICFFQEVIAGLLAAGRLTLAATQRSEMGTHPVYTLEVRGQRLALFHPGIGAPLAAAMLEEVIALGCRSFIACGGAGSLDALGVLGHIMVPTSAVRDEGTSYHYLPPAREVAAEPQVVAAIERVLQREQLSYLLTKTWTTDAIYRETRERIARRRAEGCLTVDMEAAALFAVAQFRGVRLAQLLYAGDDLSGDLWDHRGWDSQGSTRERLFWLAVDACLEL